jgi:glutamate synthase domain-containing protein 2/glutamate synthase domain-containing protein 1/glutamate synthase domain-containing protein 3
MTRGRAPTWDPRAERDACGIGFVADAKGRRSRALVDLALDALCRVRHRGAVAADAKTGDGAGLLLPIPGRFLAREAAALGLPGLDPDWTGVAMVFVSDATPLPEVHRIVEQACRAEAIDVIAWREVPVRPEALGERARATMPRILQALLLRPPSPSAAEGERLAHRARRRAEAAVRREGRAIYFPSFSFHTVTYKALVVADQLAEFYPDLTDPLVDASFVIFHQRYSTNTTPSWERAQPFRLICHNGEINTIAGNVNRMRSREGRLGKWSLLEEEVLRPVIDPSGSDSAMLDNVIELLIREGQYPGEERDVRHAVAMLIPAAWEGDPRLSPEVRDFYRWHASLMEPWDGPAAVIFTDGHRVGAALDRNGLRPLRYAVAEDGLVACASEAGAVDLRGRGRVRRGKLGPGQMIFVDPADGGFQDDPVARIARRRPYGAWLAEERLVQSPGEPRIEVPPDLERLQVVHGYTREEIALILRPAAANGKEPTFSMGDDTPLAVFSEHRRPLYNYFKQRFAQVTNPAIDHLRERFVMSLRTLLGPRDPLLWERPEAAALLEYETFFLFRPPGGVFLDATWPVAEGPDGLRRALVALAEAAVKAAQHGSGILVVSDENVSPERAPIPSLMAVGAVNTALLRAGHRTRASIVVQTDDARESHHFACLLGYGAEAIYPRLALATVASLAAAGRARDVASPEQAMLQYRAAVEEGVLKVLSKMGISCVDSYRGAQIFDAVGLAQEVIDLCFEGTPSPLGGIGFREIALDVLARHAEAFGPAPRLANPGFIKFHRGGEYHATNPAVVRALHQTVDPSGEALRSTQAAEDDDASEEEQAPAELAREQRAAHALHRAVRNPGDWALYERFAALVNERPPTEPRDLLEPVPAGPPVPLEEVEPASEILKRFSTGAISHGAISKEAHETLAVAFNRLGGKANTGEGGEDPARYRTERNCRIKQVASGRFGVTPEYCAFADELQIKIAQGSKPGEGGQLPGHKVSKEIARLRHTQPGVALISPPPHHDIYSIEDLSQLIFDLKQVNPAADVSVKLVAEVGVGTIAAGVVKGLAEVVQIAGADGGTGASPLSSIKNAGLPWEIGLAETQRALVENGLRDRARIRVDGGMKTGRDVVLAALLGADEYSFGTAALLAEGCIMVRTCHLDTCPVGIATQRPELRAKFAGTPEMVEAYFRAVAEEVRRILASLGLRSLDEAIGRTDLLRVRRRGGRGDALDLAPLLAPPGPERRFRAHLPFQRQRSSLGDRVYEDAFPAIRDGRTVELAYEITNGDRTVGARLGGAIGRAFGEAMPPGRATVRFTGQAGQSFGAFLAQGVEFRLVGEANDYVGKGMGGGRIVVVPPPDDAGDPWLVGNTVLYGATGGELFVAGRAGERFAVRNSGATAVVEGAGEHCAEYMTGGVVVVLGGVGLNLGAGMTGGECFVYDPSASLPARVNPELVEHHRPRAEDLARLRTLVERHAELTGSRRAREILAEWETAARHFWRVAPKADVAKISQKNEGTLRGARV